MFALSLSISIGLTLVLERTPIVRGLLLGQWKMPATKRGPDGPEDEFAAEGDVPPEPSDPAPPAPIRSTAAPGSRPGLAALDEVLRRNLADLERDAEREVLVRQGQLNTVAITMVTNWPTAGDSPSALTVNHSSAVEIP